MSVKRIGFVGLGQMGRGQSKNLIDKGFEVAGYDVDGAALERLVAAGGIAAASPAEAARAAELFIVLVFTAAQAEAVLFGADGAVGALEPGVPVVLHTTGAPAEAAALAERLAAAGHPMLDCPVTGGSAGAAAGTLTAIVSGPEAALSLARPALEAMCRRIVRIGEAAGQASTVKMINQLLVGVHAAAAAEAISLAVKAGADPEAVHEVITHGSGNSAVFARLVPLFLARDFASRGSLSIMLKDLAIVQEASRRHAAPTPLAAAALQQFLAAAAQGHGEADLGAVLKAYEAAAGVEVRAKG